MKFFLNIFRLVLTRYVWQLIFISKSIYINKEEKNIQAKCTYRTKSGIAYIINYNDREINYYQTSSFNEAIYKLPAWLAGKHNLKFIHKYKSKAKFGDQNLINYGEIHKWWLLSSLDYQHLLQICRVTSLLIFYLVHYLTIHYLTNTWTNHN